jgi:predicted enzyme related to lactoylglutathione lyase
VRGPYLVDNREQGCNHRDVTDAYLDIKDFIIDCADPERLALFWGSLLGRPIAARIGPYVWLRRENGLGMGFQRVASPKAGKNRVHFDLAAEDPAAEQRRVESLGGRRLTGYESGGFLVMADPEGNEFCIIPKDSFELDDEGRASYLSNQDLLPERS